MKLENKKIKLEFLENHGGKLASIFYKEKNIEFLFQNPKLEYKNATINSDFSLFEACGFDDTFPSIDKGEVIVNNKKVIYPDHGEIWSSNMFYKKIGNQIILEYYSKILPYHFKKIYTLKEKGIKVDYNIKNIGDYPFPCFYTFHCLIDSKKGIELITPESLSNIKIIHGSNRLNKETYDIYPITKDGFNLSIPDLLDDKECEKFYFTKKAKKGLIGYNYTKEKVKLLISYDALKLPYLGFWNTQGGFRNDYNFALEMSNGYYDSIEIASKNNACPYLDVDEKFSFSIDFDIINY